MVDNQRRRLLELTGTALMTGLAGCSALNKDNTENKKEEEEKTNNEETTNHKTRIEFLESHNIDTLPIVTEENIDNQAGITLEIQDGGGIEEVKLSYNNQHRDQSLTLYDKTSDEFEQGVNDKMVPISEEFPQRLLAPNTGEFIIEATDNNGIQENRKQEINTVNQSWKVDRPQSNNYSTERNWDNLNFNKQLFHDEYVSKWHQAAVYDKVIGQLHNYNEKNQKKYIAANAQSTYSNAKYEIGEVDGPGYWDTEFYSELTELEYILGDAKNTVVTHQSGVHDGAFSAWNNKCAATVEEIIHEFNTEAKEHLEETGEKAVHTGYVDEGGHGTVIAYANLEDTEIEAEHPWQFVDTTRATVAPVTEDPPSTGNYNAFVDGYSSDKLLGDYSTVETGIKATESGTLYRNEKRIASWSLENFVMNGEGNHADMDEELLGITTAISDTILEDIFNDHVPSGGSVDPIIDMVEKAIDLRQDTRKRIHVYGESLEDYEMAVVEDDELYRRSMDPEETVGTEEVENYLANLPS